MFYLFKFQHDIMNVNQIYKKLGNIVHDQGRMVDSIEANVELASVRVNEASKEITRASELKVSNTYLENYFS